MDWNALLAGGVAGTVTDITLFPLDTLKTRLQAPEGFLKAGGFKGTYKGLGAAALGSAPGASLFFATYETTKKHLHTHYTTTDEYNLPAPAIHMLAASLGEVNACLVRVPTEVVKQRMQTSMAGYSSVPRAVSQVISQHGVLGFYSGFYVTLMREFPIYEYLKVTFSGLLQRELRGYEAAGCGSVAGGIAAAVTTPLDVAKTRLMLGRDRQGVVYRGALDTLRRVASEGRGALFAGLAPRVTWISIGGFVFFGAYEYTRQLLHIQQ